MLIIDNLSEFEAAVHKHNYLICFVSSGWSGTSMAGLQKLKEISLQNKNLIFLIIDNDSAESFIYDWLKNQESAIKRNRWIDGNGETFGILKGKLVWYEPSIYQYTIYDLEKKGYFQITE